MRAKITEQVSGPRGTIFGPEGEITGHMGQGSANLAIAA